MIFSFGKRRARKETAAALARVAGAPIRYTTERLQDGTERVLGRGGAVSVTPERVVLLCDGKAVFSCPTDAVTCSELLSGDGAVFTGQDTDTGRTMTVTAHFTRSIRS